MRLNAKNNAETRLAEPVSESDTSIMVEDASVLPEVPYRLSIGDEIVEVTGADGNTLTVDRAVEGTEAFSHGEGGAVENRFTAGMYEGIGTYVKQEIDDIPETDLSGHVTEEEFSTHGTKVATQSDLGHVKVDNDTIKITSDGVISSTVEDGGFDYENDNVVIGPGARSNNSQNVAIGYNATTTMNSQSVALGSTASADGYLSFAIGGKSKADNDYEGVLDANVIVERSLSVSGSKNFEIPHPHPNKTDTH